MKPIKRYELRLSKKCNGGEMVPYAVGGWVGYEDATMEFVIEFHRTFVGKSDAKFVKCIKRDFGLECQENFDGEYKTWEILGNKVKRRLTARDIYELDKQYGILCFEEPNKIVLY
jgi:hypothetical protein